MKNVDGAPTPVEARHRALLDAIPDLMFRLSRDGEYLELAGDITRLAHTPDEVVGRNLFELLPDDVSAALLGAITEALETGALATTDYQLRTVDGSLKDFEARDRAVRQRRGRRHRP